MQSETCPLTKVHTLFQDSYPEEVVHGLEQDLKRVSKAVRVRVVVDESECWGLPTGETL